MPAHPEAGAPRLDMEYSLRAPLAQGWYFADYEAIRREDGRLCLLRVLRGRLPMGGRELPAALGGLVGRELEGCATLADLGQWAGQPALVYRMPPGLRLDEARRSSPLPLRASLGLVRSVARGVQALHRQGVLHQHLCPPLVYLDPPVLGCALTGWGLVGDPRWLLRSAPRELLPWFPPEALRGEPVDGRGDLYGLGVLLWTSLAGRAPEAPPSVEAALEQAERGLMPESDEEALGGVAAPASVLWAARRCLARRPEDRFTHAGELARVLEASLRALRHEEREPPRPRPAPLAVEEPPEPPPVPAPRSAPRGRTALLTLLLLALALSWVSRLELELSEVQAQTSPRPRPRPAARLEDPALDALLRPSGRDDLALFSGEGMSTPPTPTRPPAPPAGPGPPPPAPIPAPAPSAAASPPAPAAPAPPAVAEPEPPASRPRRLTGLHQDPWPDR